MASPERLTMAVRSDKQKSPENCGTCVKTDAFSGCIRNAVLSDRPDATVALLFCELFNDGRLLSLARTPRDSGYGKALSGWKHHSPS